ncbi:unnamed protein product [Rotaria magnacalcarata]|uniref:Uncharacterized protein n=2 Tax=Rotaria magnacalcarata TaxID=392030 RepID=A0A816NA14_9BILA|nr:unnamed protein product [Rotaria magnacalcarata]
MDRLGFSVTPTINRPIIDLNIQTNLYDSPLLPQTSVENNSHHTILNELEDKPYNCLIPSSNVQYQQKPVILPKMKIKPAECFVILPTLEIEPFPTKNTLRQKIENSHKSKLDETSASIKHLTIKTTNSQLISSNQNSMEKYLFKSQKPPQKQILLKISPRKNSKPTTTLSSSVINPSRQINRTVHLRRAHAKAKIEELSPITTKQLHESDILSASCSYSSSSHSKKESIHLQLHVQPKVRKSVKPQLQDMLGTRTMLPSLDHQFLPASSKQHEAPLFTCRKTVISTVNDEEQYKKLSTSEYRLQEKQYDLLRENGKRLANKLVQLSAGILN